MKNEPIQIAVIGRTGSGKTHVLYSIANEMRTFAETRLISPNTSGKFIDLLKFFSACNQQFDSGNYLNSTMEYEFFVGSLEFEKRRRDIEIINIPGDFFSETDLLLEFKHMDEHPPGENNENPTNITDPQKQKQFDAYKFLKIAKHWVITLDVADDDNEKSPAKGPKISNEILLDNIDAFSQSVKDKNIYIVLSKFDKLLKLDVHSKTLAIKSIVTNQSYSNLMTFLYLNIWYYLLNENGVRLKYDDHDYLLELSSGLEEIIDADSFESFQEAQRRTVLRRYHSIGTDRIQFPDDKKVFSDNILEGIWNNLFISIIPITKHCTKIPFKEDPSAAKNILGIFAPLGSKELCAAILWRSGEKTRQVKDFHSKCSFFLKELITGKERSMIKKLFR
jgi:hypothetical protein